MRPRRNLPDVINHWYSGFLTGLMLGIVLGVGMAAMLLT